MNGFRFLISRHRKTAACAAALIACAAILAATHRSFADFNRAYNLPNAANVYITPRGQDYFSQHQLVGILERNGVDLSHGKLASWQYDADAALNLNRLSGGLRPYQATLNSLRTVFREWLLGFDLHNPLFHVKVREAGYDLEGLDIGFKVDPVLTSTLGDTGIAAIVTATIPHLRVHAQDICGYDSSNPIFGTCKLLKEGAKRYLNGFGIYHPWIELRDSQPLVFSVPITLQILPGGLLQFEALKVTSNIEKLRFASGQDRNLLVPKVQIQIGSQTTTINSGPLVTELMGREPQLVQLGIHNLNDFIAQELPTRLNQMAFDPLKKGFEMVNSIDPPGIDTFGNGTKLDWGLRASGLSIRGEDVVINLDSYVADPEMTWDEKLPRAPTALPPQLKGRNPSDYDFALVINNQVVQRILYLAQMRGGLGPIDVNDADHGCRATHQARIASAPLLTSGSGGHAHMGVRLQLDRDGSWGQAFALKNPFQVNLDLDVRTDLSTDPKYPNAFDLVLDHINLDNSRIDPRFIDHAAEIVQKNLRTALQDTRCGPMSRKLTDTPIQIPDTVFGLPLKLLQTEFDAHGYLVLYMSYGDRH